jgi:N-sulfoglucosamine sulfohydrolase
MRASLHAWMVGTRDTSLLPEVEMCHQSKGSSPYTMARAEGPLHVARVLNAAELVGRGPGQLDNLREALGSPNTAIKFWGATGLAALGPQAAPATEQLKAALKDRAPNVRLAAAEVLCRLGHQDDALPVLLGHLTDENPRVRLTAAIHLVAVAEKARSIKPRIERIAQGIEPTGTFPMYTRWALDYAMEKMGP